MVSARIRGIVPALGRRSVHMASWLAVTALMEVMFTILGLPTAPSEPSPAPAPPPPAPLPLPWPPPPP